MEAFCASLILPLCAFAKNLILTGVKKTVVPVKAYRSFGRRAGANCYVGGSGGIAADGL